MPRDAVAEWAVIHTGAVYAGTANNANPGGVLSIQLCSSSDVMSDRNRACPAMWTASIAITGDYLNRCYSIPGRWNIIWIHRLRGTIRGNLSCTVPSTNLSRCAAFTLVDKMSLTLCIADWRSHKWIAKCYKSASWICNTTKECLMFSADNGRLSRGRRKMGYELTSLRTQITFYMSDRSNYTTHCASLDNCDL